MADTVDADPQHSLQQPPPTYQTLRRDSLYSQAGIAARSLPSLSQSASITGDSPAFSPPREHIQNRWGSPAHRKPSLCDGLSYRSRDKTLVGTGEFRMSTIPDTSELKIKIPTALESAKTLTINTACSLPEQKEGNVSAMTDDDRLVLSPTSYDEAPKPTVPLEPCSPVMMAKWVYDRNVVVPRAYTQLDQIETLDPVELNYRRRNSVDKWETCVHPANGNIYFHRKSPAILTNSLLCDNTEGNEILACAEIATRQIEEMLQEYKNVPDDTVTVLEVREDDQRVYYYCASWERRRIFWLEEVKIHILNDYQRPIYDKAHAGIRNDVLFWNHVHMFPIKPLDQKHISELKDMVNSAFIDTMTSTVSLSPYDTNQLARLKEAIDDLRTSQSEQNEFTTSAVASLLSTFHQERFLNFHGQPGARMSADDALYQMSNTKPRSLGFRIVSSSLFWWPSVYLREVEDIWIDETVRQVAWDRFISDLRQDWERSATPATVLLTANVSYLAIQSIDMGHGIDARSVAQIASYASTMFSLANYITCQVLLRQHRRVTKDPAVHAMNYLWRQEKCMGHEMMAIAFSLPHAFFIWSLLTFLFSICWTFFWQTNISTRIILGTLLAILSGLVTLVISLDWCSDMRSSWPFVLFTRYKEKWDTWRDGGRDDPEATVMAEEDGIRLEGMKGDDDDDDQGTIREAGGRRSHFETS